MWHVLSFSHTLLSWVADTIRGTTNYTWAFLALLYSGERICSLIVRLPDGCLCLFPFCDPFLSNSVLNPNPLHPYLIPCTCRSVGHTPPVSIQGHEGVEIAQGNMCRTRLFQARRFAKVEHCAPLLKFLWRLRPTQTYPLFLVCYSHERRADGEVNLVTPHER